MELVSIIEYQGDNNTVVWKHPTVNFNNNSQLIVRESQIAIFYLNGEALDSFEPGKHTLETGKIPLLSEKLFGKITGGEVYHSEVYFVNLVEQMSICWGMNPRIKFIDKTVGNYQFDIGVFGKLSLKVNNPRKIVQNFVGTENALGQEKLMSYISPSIMQKVRTQLAKTLNQQEISIFELDMHTDEIAELLMTSFREQIRDYGLDITGFWIEGFDFPENDPTYKRILELRGQSVTTMQEQKMKQALAMDALKFEQNYEIGRVNLDAEKELVKARTESEKTIIDAKAMATKRATEGYSYVTERAYDVAEKLSENDNIGNLSTTGVGLGMMGGMAFGVGGALSNTISDALSPINRNSDQNMNDIGESEGFISIKEDGSNVDDFEEKVKKLQYLKKMEIISEEEYEVKKREILDNI